MDPERDRVNLAGEVRLSRGKGARRLSRLLEGEHQPEHELQAQVVGRERP